MKKKVPAELIHSSDKLIQGTRTSVYNKKHYEWTVYIYNSATYITRVLIYRSTHIPYSLLLILQVSQAPLMFTFSYKFSKAASMIEI